MVSGNVYCTVIARRQREPFESKARRIFRWHGGAVVVACLSCRWSCAGIVYVEECRASAAASGRAGAVPLVPCDADGGEEENSDAVMFRLGCAPSGGWRRP